MFIVKVFIAKFDWPEGIAKGVAPKEIAPWRCLCRFIKNRRFVIKGRCEIF
jgi:hypothetical protein